MRFKRFTYWIHRYDFYAAYQYYRELIEEAWFRFRKKREIALETESHFFMKNGQYARKFSAWWLKPDHWAENCSKEMENYYK